MASIEIIKSIDWTHTVRLNLGSVLMAEGPKRRDSELLARAVSAVNGCGLCISSHERKLREQGQDRQAIQSTVRIAALVYAAAGVLEYTAGHAAAEG